MFRISVWETYHCLKFLEINVAVIVFHRSGSILNVAPSRLLPRSPENASPATRHRFSIYRTRSIPRPGVVFLSKREFSAACYPPAASCQTIRRRAPPPAINAAFIGVL